MKPLAYMDILLEAATRTCYTTQGISKDSYYNYSHGRMKLHNRGEKEYALWTNNKTP